MTPDPEILTRLLTERDERIKRLKARVDTFRERIDWLEVARDNWHNEYLREASKTEQLRAELTHARERNTEYLHRLAEFEDWCSGEIQIAPKKDTQ